MFDSGKSYFLGRSHIRHTVATGTEIAKCRPISNAAPVTVSVTTPFSWSEQGHWTQFLPCQTEIIFLCTLPPPPTCPLFISPIHYPPPSLVPLRTHA